MHTYLLTAALQVQTSKPKRYPNNGHATISIVHIVKQEQYMYIDIRSSVIILFIGKSLIKKLDTPLGCGSISSLLFKLDWFTPNKYDSSKNI